MGQSADQIRRDIEQTRHDLGETIDEVADRANPKHIAKRGKNRMTKGMHSARDKVMGSAEEAVHKAEGQAKGNPLAAGLIALGGGLLAASLLPSSKPERQAAQTLAHEAQPLAKQAKSEAKHVGQQLTQEVKHSAQDATQHVKEQAQQSAQEVKKDASSSAQHVRGEAQHAAQDVKHQAESQQ